VRMAVGCCFFVGKWKAEIMHAWLVHGNDSAKVDHMNLDTLTLDWLLEICLSDSRPK
jgi:hypothetical protein